MKKTLLWLDDYRDPFDKEVDWLVYSPISRNDLEVVWVKNYDQFKDWIMDNGLPDAICFDHDLADEHYDIGRPSNFMEFDYSLTTEKTGMDCAKWLTNYCTEFKKPLPLFNVHSANPAGRKNIREFLNNYNKHN
jgi:hypothetical protein